MSSLIYCASGYNRWWMSHMSPSFLETRHNWNTCSLTKCGFFKGPATRCTKTSLFVQLLNKSCIDCSEFCVPLPLSFLTLILKYKAKRKAIKWKTMFVTLQEVCEKPIGYHLSKWKKTWAGSAMGWWWWVLTFARHCGLCSDWGLFRIFRPRAGVHDNRRLSILV